MSSIMLTDLLRLDHAQNYKLHLGCRAGQSHPLDEYVKDNGAWAEWNANRGNKNDWTRKYILSFIEFYPVPNAWLFGGVFEVRGRSQDGYDLGVVGGFDQFLGRLVCKFPRPRGMRGRAFKLENYIHRLEVLEVLPERYDGEKFPGYENLNHTFGALQGIVRKETRDWMAALKAVKGVYLIIDRRTGGTYVGSAYGDDAIWSRLACYVQTGHGGNKELVKVVKDRGLGCVLDNFSFSLLEIFTRVTADEAIIRRESHWKNVLLSRGFGFNRN